MKAKTRAPWNKVVRLVREELSKADFAPLGLQVNMGDVHKEDGFWRVDVHLTKTPKSSYSLNSVLADVETNLEFDHDINIHFWPIYPNGDQG